MESQRQIPAEAYPTRRSLREAQRRAEEDERNSTRQAESGASISLTATSAALEAVRNLPNLPAGEVKELAKKSGILRRSAVPRVAILGSLAAATTFVPLNGPLAASAEPEEVIEYGATDLLDVLLETDSDVSAPASALAADPLAGVRAVATASRKETRTPTSCSAEARAVNGSGHSEVGLATPQLVMPLEEGSYRTTSQYGFRSLFGRYSKHEGLDMAAPAGTPIHAIADGVVEYTGPGKDGRSSMLIVIKHEINGEVTRSWYVHMYSNGVYTTPGQKVRAGQVIGAVGSNGYSTGPHLHLEIHLDDNLTTTDPATWLAANGAVALDREIQDCLAN